MRQSRAKIKKESKGRKLTLLIVFALILPVTSIILGYLGTKHLILPNLSSEEIPDQERTQEQSALFENMEKKEEFITSGDGIEEAFMNTFELQGFDIFSIQVGNFSAIENAQVLAKELASKGMGAYIYHNNGYKVITVSMLDRGNIDAVMPEIAQEYEGAFVITTNVPVRAIKYRKNNLQYATVLEKQNKNLIQIFQDLSAGIYQARTNALSSDEFENLIIQSHNQIKDVKREMSKLNPPTNLKQLHKNYLNIIKQFDEGLEVIINQEKENKAVEVQNRLTAILYQYSDFITKTSIDMEG